MGTDITNYDEAWAKAAERYAGEHKVTGGTFLTTRGGVLKYGDQELPGNQCVAIVLDSVRENTYYGDRFDEDNPVPPLCYAFGRFTGDMGPHISMRDHLDYFQPQANDCTSCPWNKWGSAEKGKGKACQNRQRLAIIPAGFFTPRRGTRDYDIDLVDDPKVLAQMDIAYLKLPVTSSSNYDKYVSSLTTTVDRPPYGVYTRIFLEPHTKFQYTVNFELLEQVPNELFKTISARNEDAARSIVQGYQPPDPEDQAPTQPQGSLRGALRGRR